MMQALSLRDRAWRSYIPCRMLPGMAGRLFKQWRKYRGFTLEQVADRLAFLNDPGVPQTVASLSRLENDKQPYAQRVVEALAHVYDCEPEELIGVDPFERDELDELMAAMKGKSEIERARIARIIRALNVADSGEDRNLSTA